MANAEIIAAGIDFAPGRKGVVWHALQRIGSSGDGWHGPVEMIEILRVIDGGRSGAMVLEIALRAGGEYRQRVVKIGPAAEMAAEFANFHRFLAEYPATVCAPIQEATPGAADRSRQREGEIEAVVYSHVTDYAGRPRGPAPTLEDMVRSAFYDETPLADVRQLIEQLFTKMATPFHNRHVVHEALSLRDLNPTLGPDLVLSPEQVQTELRYSEDVLEASLGSGEFPPGTEVHIADSGGGEIRVEMLDAGTGMSGRVVRSRFDQQRERLDGAFGTLERADGAVIADGVRSADPASGLRAVLTDPRFGRVRGVVHGDLNARNVMCVVGQPILIDFAKTADALPVLSDAAWLEVSLLRDVFAVLPYADLVRVQRLLALATKIRPWVSDVAEIERIFDRLLGDRAAVVVFRVLSEIRVSSQRGHPGTDAWLDHLAQLHLSAYRTVKWADQSDAKLRAVHAAAAVATEWLAGADPFAHWESLPELLRAIAPAVDLARPEVVAMVTGLLTTVDSRQPGIPFDDIDELRDRFVRTHFLAQARELVVELSREHGEFHEWGFGDPDRSVVLTGGPGAGKSRLLRELAYRGAIDIAGPGPASGPLRMPILVAATELVAGPDVADLPVSREALVLGAVRILLDGLDEVQCGQRTMIAEWSRSLLRRFPRLRLMVAVRNGSWAEEAFGLPVMQLPVWKKWDVDAFLRDRSVLSDPARLQARKDILKAHDADGGATPGFVVMFADAAAKSRRPPPVDSLYDEYFAGDLTPEAVAALGSLAVASVGTGGPVPPDAPVEAFLDRGILESRHSGVRFFKLAERDFFAARALAEADEEFVRERARAFAWREICLLAARLPGTPDAVVELMARTVSTADARFAAQLLAFRPAAAAAAELRAFCVARLADPEAGAYAHRVAAEALSLLNIPIARQDLAEILLAHATPPATQLEILDCVDAHLLTQEADGDWVHVLGAILAGAYPVETCIGAIDVIRSGRIRGLELLLAELVRLGEPRVAAAAVDTLHSFGAMVPRGLKSRRSVLDSRQLEEIEARLPTLSGAGEVRAANEKRVLLLSRMGTHVLLRRRFSYGIGYGVNDLLPRLRVEAPDDTELSRLAELPEPEANALAHQILSQPPKTPEHRDELVFAAHSGSPLHLLLIAAAAAKSPASVDHVVKLVGELAPVVEADRIEGLAALGQAVVLADRRRGFAVTRRANKILREHDVAARRYWPWITMMAQTGPTPGELDRLLADGVDGAIEGLAGYAPSWDGRGGPSFRLGPDARKFVLDSRDAGDAGGVEWALAVAAAGLTEAIAGVLEIAGNRELGITAETISSGRYGILELTPLARVLAALGGLARESAEAGEVHRFLGELNVTGLHPSTGHGRLAGMAFLGDWEPLLRVAPGDGGPLDAAAREAVRGWAPGPCTPAELREPGNAARGLVRLLTEPGLPPGRRSLLEELTHEVEESHGKLLAR